MGEWILHEEDTFLPSWLARELNSNCKYCSNKMLNYYNDDFRCTARKCSNDNCVGVVASRADFMIKLLNIKGIGFATCLDKVKSGSYYNHVELLKVFNIEVTTDLSTFLRIHCFKDVDSVWESICTANDFYTLDELFDKYNGKYKGILIANKDLLYGNLKYVTLKQKPNNRLYSEKSECLNIMITGTPSGYDSKEDFIDKLNSVLNGKIVILHQRTKRQSGVDYLIREAGSSTKGKLEAAIKGGIPVVTSEEFINILIDKINIKNEK